MSGVGESYGSCEDRLNFLDGALAYIAPLGVGAALHGRETRPITIIKENFKVGLLMKLS